MSKKEENFYIKNWLPPSKRLLALSINMDGFIFNGRDLPNGIAKELSKKLKELSMEIEELNKIKPSNK